MSKTSQNRKKWIIIISVVVTLGTTLPFFLRGKKTEEKSSTLVFVHAIMRHGDKNPTPEQEIYKSNPYYNETFYPEGYGLLNSKGKKTAYNIGVQLRSRYKDFLPSIWNIKNLAAQSTDYDRTRLTILLVLAGLYPAPKFQFWSYGINWQPVPYKYLPQHEDKELLAHIICPRYFKLQAQVLDGLKDYVKKYEDAFKIIERNTNLSMSLYKGFQLYSGFHTQSNIGLPLDDWVYTVYPEPLRSIMIDFYNVLINNTAITRVSTGYLLKKIILDSETKIYNSTWIHKKMQIYAAHEANIFTLLSLLGHEKYSEVPPYGAYILIEIHQIMGVYGIKIFYQDYKHKDPQPIKIKGCDYFCPHTEFFQIIEPLIPSNDDECFSTE